MSPWTSELFLSAQSDDRLVSLARAGHERAFAVIVSRYRRELLAFARQLGSDGRAEDVVQQSFLNALAALRGGSEVRHLRGWLYQIVRNGVRATPPAGPEVLTEAMGSAEAVEDTVEHRLVAFDALRAVSDLPEQQRQALVGTAVQGLAGQDLARVMGVSEGAVRQLVCRARRAVRTAVTAITPYPLARFFADGSSAQEVALGVSGGATAGGLALKLGALATSAVLAGAAVGGHGDHHRAQAGRHARPGQAGSGLGNSTTTAAVSRPVLEVGQREAGLRLSAVTRDGRRGRRSSGRGDEREQGGSGGPTGEDRSTLRNGSNGGSGDGGPGGPGPSQGGTSGTDGASGHGGGSSGDDGGTRPGGGSSGSTQASGTSQSDGGHDSGSSDSLSAVAASDGGGSGGNGGNGGGSGASSGGQGGGTGGGGSGGSSGEHGGG